MAENKNLTIPNIWKVNRETGTGENIKWGNHIVEYFRNFLGKLTPTL